jgi:NAD(P)-dependent dehydrogenase (short-subunit alcohol dehydrogenase family)
MTTVGIATGGGRGMGYECGRKLTGMVDHVILVDRDEESVAKAAVDLSASAAGAVVEPFVLDITDADGLGRLAGHVGSVGTLRAVAHAAGISPTMADWRRIFEVDLVGTALLAQTLRPLATTGTAMVCFASMSAVLTPPHEADAAFEAIMADPLDETLLDRLHEVAGSSIENSGWAYGLAKRGVKQFVQREAVRLGPLGARICSISPGIIDTPQGRQEAEVHPSMARLVRQTPVGRMGRPEELAAVTAFLLSDEASFLTGIDVLVDGGVYAALSTQPRP